MNLFNSVKVKKPKRNNFNLSHSVRLSLQIGNLVPTLCMPVLPGDTVTLKNDIVIRLAPQLAPVMADVNVYCHYFFVPWRIIWKNYPTFMTGGDSGVETVSFPRIKFPVGKITSEADIQRLTEGSLMDYLGYPLPCSARFGERSGDIKHEYSVSQLPLRAYQRIYDEYYRDQNVEPSYPQLDGDGSIDFDSASAVLLMQMRTRAWAKDYFTSALPEPQRGPDVPLFDVNGDSDSARVVFDPTGVTLAKRQGFDSDSLSGANIATQSYGNGTELTAQLPSGEGQGVNIDNSSNLKIEGGNLDFQAPTMNDLRRRMSLQRFLEISNRAGNRLKEFVIGHFGAVIPDSTLQRPLYLGGGSQKILFTDVIQNSASVMSGNTSFDDTALGQTAGYGICTGNTGKVRHHFTEHGYVMCIMSIRPKAEYFQGIDKHLQKFDRFDHAFPEFAHLGEQEILNKEVMFDPTIPTTSSVDYDGTFGYTPRYAEYKFMNNRVCGEFRTSLSYWHLARVFDAVVPPTLSKEFIHVSPQDDNRIFAVHTTPTDPVEHYYSSVYHKIIVKRCLPKYGNPSFL